MRHPVPNEAGEVSRSLPYRTQFLIVGAFALAGALLFGLATVLGHSSAEVAASTAPRNNDETFRPTPEQLKQLQIEPVASRSFTTEQFTEGKIAMNADRTTAVFSAFSGTVAKLIANPGDNVRKGDPLLAVNATEFVQAHNDLVSAYAGLRSARAQLKQAEVAAQRKQGLFDINAGSMQDVQQSQADLAVAQSNVSTAETALSSARGKLHILGKSEAEIDKLQASEHVDTTAFIAAPIDGTVIDRQVGLGQYIQADPGNRLFSISDLSTVWLVANVREADAAAIAPGAAVQVRVPAYPDRVFQARVTYVASTVDPATRRIAVRAEIRNADGALKPEMFASFSIADGPASQAAAVPEKAVLYEGENTHVWVIGAKGEMTLRAVHVGRSGGGMLEVLDGLSPGESVVTGGSIFIDRAAQSD